MNRPDDEMAAVKLLRERGYAVVPSNRKDGTDTQRLWVCRWGTMSALVWAQSQENAEMRVRHGVFDRRATTYEVKRAPERVKGDVFVREATDADLLSFEECGGKVPA